MRILSVITGFSSGGAETLVRNLAREMTLRGHRCHIVVCSNSADLGNCTDFEARFKDELSGNGITFEVLGHGARRNPIYGAIRLRKAVKAFGPDVMHVHTAYGLLFQAIGMLRVPTVYTHHNVRVGFPPALFRIFDRVVDRYVAICEACRIVLEKQVRRPIGLIFNGVPAEFTAARPKSGLPSQLNVLSVGALSGQKDYPTLIRAAALCAPRFFAGGRDIRFRIAGSGPAMPELRNLIAETGMDHHVELLGTRSDVRQLMLDADLLVNSSIYEGLPITLIEAAMAGLPAVATDVGGNAEVVLHGKTGFIVPPGEPGAIAERIVQLLSDVGLHAQFSEAAIAHSCRFTIKSCADAHLALYESVVASGVPAEVRAAPASG